jgi:hypothetical protein
MPMSNSTLDALAHFSRNEQKLTEGLFGETQSAANESYEPSAFSVQHVLNYSKALSVRKSEHLEHITVILN